MAEIRWRNRDGVAQRGYVIGPVTKRIQVGTESAFGVVGTDKKGAAQYGETTVPVYEDVTFIVIQGQDGRVHEVRASEVSP